MERHRDQDFEQIRQSLLRMGGLVERMISEAMAALVERDTARAQAVIRTDSEVDQLEKELDDACYAVLALQQPTAIDFFFVLALMVLYIVYFTNVFGSRTDIPEFLVYGELFLLSNPKRLGGFPLLLENMVRRRLGSGPLGVC